MQLNIRHKRGIIYIIKDVHYYRNYPTFSGLKMVQFDLKMTKHIQTITLSKYLTADELDIVLVTSEYKQDDIHLITACIGERNVECIEVVE